MERVARPQRVLGIDPGLQCTGYGVLELAEGEIHLCEAGVIRTKRHELLSERLKELFEGITEVLESWEPQATALEELYSHGQYPRTAVLMGHARGVICLACAQREIPVIHYGSTQIKKMVTGNGRASKDQMQRAIARQLKVAALPGPADVADALALALCHCYALRQELLGAGECISQGG